MLERQRGLEEKETGRTNSNEEDYRG
jgi:hypothetical protein